VVANGGEAIMEARVRLVMINHHDLRILAMVTSSREVNNLAPLLCRVGRRVERLEQLKSQKEEL
jgi:hypothetical protein